MGDADRLPNDAGNGWERPAVSADDLARIDAEIPAAAGDRYDRIGMMTVNR